MVFVDTNQEKHWHYRQDPMPEIGVYRAPYEDAIDEGLDYLEDGGLRKDTKLPIEEWKNLNADRARPNHEIASAAEYKAWQKDGVVLGAKKQFETQPLGDRPVSILRADGSMECQRMYDAGVGRGNGTEEERADYRAMIARWDENDIPQHKEQLKLSNKGRFVNVKGGLHCIHLTHPDEVAEEIKWVIEQAKSS